MNYSVNKEGERLPVRTAAVYPSPYHRNDVMEYVQFVWKEPVTLRIRSEKRAESVIARPLSSGIAPKLEDGEILLYLDRPAGIERLPGGKSADTGGGERV